MTLQERLHRLATFLLMRRPQTWAQYPVTVVGCYLKQPFAFGTNVRIFQCESLAFSKGEAAQSYFRFEHFVLLLSQ